MKQQLAAIEHALNSDTPDLSEPLGLPMSEAIAADAARPEIVEREKGLLRDEKLRARALQKLDTELAAIWFATRPSQKGLSPLKFAIASGSGLRSQLVQDARAYHAWGLVD